jgi:hypothetical protein
MTRLLTTRRAALCAAALVSAAIAAPAAAYAHTPHPTVSLFPTDALTVHDGSQLTGRRVALPLPDCTTQPTDCNTIRLLNQLDGFDIDPQLALTFSTDVDPVAVAAATTVTNTDDGVPLGVDRVVYDASTHTVYAHPVAQLAPDTRYLLRLHGNRHNGLPDATTTFTTMSATNTLLRIRRQLDSGAAYQAAGIPSGDRGLHTDANVPAAGTTLTYTQDLGSVGGLHTVFEPITSATGAGHYIFGSFTAPSWINGDTVIPQTGTRGPGPVVQGRTTLPFVLIVPAGTAPSPASTATCSSPPTSTPPTASPPSPPTSSGTAPARRARGTSPTRTAPSRCRRTRAATTRTATASSAAPRVSGHRSSPPPTPPSPTGTA